MKKRARVLSYEILQPEGKEVASLTVKTKEAEISLIVDDEECIMLKLVLSISVWNTEGLYGQLRKEIPLTNVNLLYPKKLRRSHRRMAVRSMEIERKFDGSNVTLDIAIPFATFKKRKADLSKWLQAIATILGLPQKFRAFMTDILARAGA